MNLKKGRILGIDPGTGILGFGIIDTDESNQPKLVDAGVIRTTPDRSDAERLADIQTDLEQIINEFKPSSMAVEKLFFAQNITTAMTVSQARGVVLALGARAGLEVFEYTPLQIKQALTSYGRATKNQMQEMVKVILKLQSIPKPDDCADALAAAITHLMTVR
ncbi:MAG TPA: crossover junction endodeoxyribonuclease RuvC [Candidatus Saccharimonadales bacterium]|nr:crossover junction endodeoxyribonuclease RuvC [Candidatus Saccharimonadales bacterium]